MMLVCAFRVVRNMAIETAELEMESKKQLNNDDGEFQNGERFIAVDSDSTKLSVCDTNILNPTTATNRSPNFLMMTNDGDYEETSFIDSNSGSQVFEAETEGEQSQAAEQTSSVSAQNSKINRPYMKQIKRMRILSFQRNYESKEDTFEEVFPKHRYLGSFRLQFSRDESAFYENRAQVDNADATNQSLESQRITNDDNKSCSENSHRSQALSSQGSYESSVDTFEEAFSKHRYAGSFRLQFYKDELVAQENRTQINNSNPTESATVNLQNENLKDIQELSEPTTSPCRRMVKSNIDNKMSGRECEKGPTNTDLEVHTNEIEVREDTNMRDPSTAINAGEIDKSFCFYPSEEEPILHPTFMQRAEKAVSTIIQSSNSRSSSCCSCVQDCTNCCSSGFTFECCTTSTAKFPKGCHFPHFSIELKAASRQGTKMLRSFLFPTMPKLLTDFWVMAEFGVTLAQFVLSVLSIMIDSNRTYNVIYLVLSSLALLLAFVDALVYFKDFATCSRYFHNCCSRLSTLKYRSRIEENSQHNLSIQGFRNNSILDLDVSIDVDSEQIANDHIDLCSTGYGCCHLADKSKLKTIISESFELVRTILSELLIYPLLMFDLLDVIVGGSYQLTSTMDRLNLSLFIIGLVFLILSVYVSRAFMVISMTVQLRRMPIDPSKSKINILGVVTEFCIYVLFQISVHVAVIMAVGAKLYQENPTPCQDIQASCIQVSPSLIYVMVCGGILPFYGMLVFFILNYFQLQEISVGFWTNMVSLLHSENFSNLVFSTNGIEETKMKAEGLINSIQLHQVKSQLTKIMSTPSWVKIMYPLKFPFFIPVLVLYVAIVFLFIAALAFTYEQNIGFTFTLFENNFSPAFFILAIIVLAANLHVIILVFVAMLGMIAIILTTILQPIFCLLGACAYVPVGGCLSLLSLVSPKKES